MDGVYAYTRQLVTLYHLRPSEQPGGGSATAKVMRKGCELSSSDQDMPSQNLTTSLFSQPHRSMDICTGHAQGWTSGFPSYY